MRSRGMKVLSAALTLVLLGSLALAQGPAAHMRGEGMMFGGPGLDFFAEMLSLTDAQQTQIKQLFESQKATIEPLRQQEHQNHLALLQLITSGNFDEAKAQAITQQASQVQAQLMLEHVKIAAQAYQILTPDQKTKLNDFLTKQQQRFQQRMQQKSESSSNQ
jgi:periplasmic protein CpxP/Spy